MRSQAKKLFYKIIDLINKVSGNFVSVSVRPVYARDIVLKPIAVLVPKKTAIIIQGPLKKELDFTLETIKLYKRTLLPTTEIVVSTWDDEDEETLNQLRSMGVHVVTASKPSNRGIFNVNLQLTSVVQALNKCSQLNVDFVLKTRTDIRIYAPNIEEYLAGLLEAFPPAAGYDQKYRILGFSLNSYMYRLYYVSDITVYGHISDMKKYWEVPLDTRTKEPDNINWTLRAWSEARMVETYLASTYLEKIGKTLTWTLEDSFRALAENFIIIDDQSIDLYWYKYRSWMEYRNRNYKSNKNNACITFRDWFTLYNNQGNLGNISESIIDLPFGSEIK